MLAEQSQIELGTIVNPATEEEENPTPPPQQWLKALEGEDWSHTQRHTLYSDLQFT